MQKTMKKTLSIILAILMIVTTIPMAFAADVVKSGNCGANGGNVKWTLDSDGTLTISGTGDMQTFATLAKRPWYDYTHDIKKIIIEDGVTSISDYTAYGCFFATSISIGKDVKSIGPSDSTFYCRDLETITVSEDNEYYKSVDNVLFSKDGKELLKVAPKALSGTYNVPDGVVKIYKQAFQVCSYIEKVVLPDSVEEISEYAFYECDSLEILDIGMAKLSSVGETIFANINTPVEVIADKDNEYVSVVNGSLFSKIDGTLFYAYVTDNKYVVPYGVKIIPEFAIYIEDGSVVVPDTVETIERNGIDAYDSVVHYLGTESQLQEIYEGDMSDFEWLNMSMHYCVQQSNIPASCTDDGVTEWYCSTCDETIKYVTGYAFGHDIVEVEAKAPTCTEIGWDAYEYCTACTYTTYVEKEALNHKDTLVKVNAKAPTCTEIGWDAYEYCTACDYSTYVELPAITHTDANCDYKCDYNCGYVYETLDFSDAKAITEENGILYIDGEKAEDDGVTFLLHAGKYKLAENISTSYIWIEGEVVLDLNGYVWDLEDSYIAVNAPFSVYDTSAEENGKITSTFFCTIDTNSEYGVFSLYSGTIENNSVYEDRMAISAMWASANLYGGKVKGNGYALSASSDYNIDKTVVLGDVVLESGEGYAQIKLSLKSYVDGKKINIDVTDYTGESLETDVEAESTGKFDILKGVSSADEAEKYKLNIVTNYNNFHEKTEYDEATGDVNIYIAKNAFTQQPSAENCFTVDFNNPAATFQWYEVEEEIIGTYVAESFSNLFTYNFKAGDILKVSTDSDVDLAHLAIGNEYLTLTQTQKSKTIKFNADKTITVSTKMLDIEGIELEFSIIRETALDGETGKALKNPECKKSYCCKATVNGRVYNSDTVVGHEIIQVEEKAATCTETGWEAYGYCTECDYTTYKEIPASHEILQVGAKAATCTETGWEAYEYCTACTYTTYVELPENGHTPLEAVKENEVAPKCDVTGSYDLVVYCDDCGAELDRDTKTVDALKHSFTKYEVTEEAKCGVAGKEVAACDNGCGATDEKAIEALKHDIVIDEAVAPKCGETGLTQGEHCTRCDYKVEQEIVPALEHKDADGDYKCDNGCGHEFEKPAPEEPTPDTPDEPTDEVCDHLCHKGGFMGFIWKIVKFFWKLFKMNPVCECGAAHY